MVRRSTRDGSRSCCLFPCGKGRPDADGRKDSIFLRVHALESGCGAVIIPHAVQHAVDHIEQQFALHGVTELCGTAGRFIGTDCNVRLNRLCIAAFTRLIEGEYIGGAQDAGVRVVQQGHLIIAHDSHVDFDCLNPVCFRNQTNGFRELLAQPGEIHAVIQIIGGEDGDA